MSTTNTNIENASKNSAGIFSTIQQTATAMFPDGTSPEQIKAYHAQMQGALDAAKKDPVLMKKMTAAAEAMDKFHYSSEVHGAVGEYEPATSRSAPPVSWKGIVSEFLENHPVADIARRKLPLSTAGQSVMSCSDISGRASRYYDNLNGSPTLKPYVAQPGKTPGQVAADIPKLGDIAACRGR